MSLFLVLFTRFTEISSRCLSIVENVKKNNPESKPAETIIKFMFNGKPDKKANEIAEIIVIIPTQKSRECIFN